MTLEFKTALARALVIGVFGGTALVLTMRFSRRGPMILPVYAAILFTIALSLSRFATIGFAARFAIVFAAIGVSTVLSMIGGAFLAAADRKRHPPRRPIGRSHMPVWALPLLVAILSAVSAGTAFVSS